MDERNIAYSSNYNHLYWACHAELTQIYNRWVKGEKTLGEAADTREQKRWLTVYQIAPCYNQMHVK